jgi:hypothetical protein
METIWKYLSIQFEVETRDSFKKALKLSNYHMSVLQKVAAEDPLTPLWLVLMTRYQPLHNAIVQRYNAWKNARGAQQGETLNVDQLLALMTANLNIWDPQIQVVFNRTSPQYKAMFPQGRTPFQQGPKDLRIEAVGALADALQPFPALSAVQSLVVTYYSQLDTARDTQGGAKGYTGVMSNTMENARVNAMIMQYRDLALLMDHFWDNLTMVENFFDLATLRESAQTEYTATLEAGESHALLTHTFMADEELTVKLYEAGGPLAIYLASFEGGTDSTPVIVPPHGNVTFMAEDFGITDYGLHRHITVINQGAALVRIQVNIEA